MKTIFPAVCAAVAAIFVALSASAFADVPVGDITLSNGTLYEDGEPWIPAGFTYFKMNKPTPSHRTTDIPWVELFAAQISTFGADTVRIQVAEDAVDERSPEFSPAYLEELEKGVRDARERGLAVILSMKRAQGGETPKSVPDEGTERAWRVLAERFNADLGIMYELLNEPIGRGSGLADGWDGWQTEMERLIDVIRATGSTNVLIAEGKNSGKILTGAPDLADPQDAVAYAVHPYPVSRPGGKRRKRHTSLHRSDWDEDFGDFCRQGRVCMVTEWMSGSGTKCLPPDEREGGTPAYVQEFLSYLRENGIALAGAWAFDHVNPQFTIDYTTFEPNSFGGDFRCKRGAGAFGGPGELFKELWDAQ
jgi:hypothetical protein